MKITDVKNAGTEKAEITFSVSMQDLEWLENAVEKNAKDDQCVEMWSLWGTIRAAQCIASGKLSELWDYAGHIFNEVKKWKEE